MIINFAYAISTTVAHKFMYSVGRLCHRDVIDMSTSKEEQRLLKASELGELSTVRELVENKGLNPNKVFDRSSRWYCNHWTVGWTPLHHACA